ncbi:MAG TPA: AI-2E family transporter [Nevskiaceae bacterium]|nr:AI-2E family transporter [Nevskiaceae bacterium]
MNESRWPAARENLPWLLAGTALLVLVYLLAPILSPFVIGAGLAYLGDPLVDRLQRLGLSRTAGVALVFVVLSLLGLLGLLLILPLIQQQVATLLTHLPDWLQRVQDELLPRLGMALPEGVRLDAEGLRQLAAEHWQQAGGVLKTVWAQISQSSGALLTAFANLLLVPIVAFYLLRDWDPLVAWVRGMIPPRALPGVDQLARETDEVLGAFIRGQLLVMLALAVYFTVALSLVGLELALLVGVVVGLTAFVPYLGSLIGLLTALVACLMQSQELALFLWVAGIFAAGQFLEGNVLTPWLIGDRIGLHPVTVIFAILAGGQLFGFVGVLLALPVAAVLAVLLRHAKQRWLQSPLYRRGAPETAALEASAVEPAPPGP